MKYIEFKDFITKLGFKLDYSQHPSLHGNVFKYKNNFIRIHIYEDRFHFINNDITIFDSFDKYYKLENIFIKELRYIKLKSLLNRM